MNTENSAIVSLYVVKNSASGSYFAGFDASKQQANFVEEPIHAKKFTNKYDIKLRPGEALVELTIDLAQANVGVSEPFRPQRRLKATH